MPFLSLKKKIVKYLKKTFFEFTCPVFSISLHLKVMFDCSLYLTNDLLWKYRVLKFYIAFFIYFSNSLSIWDICQIWLYFGKLVRLHVKFRTILLNILNITRSCFIVEFCITVTRKIRIFKIKKYILINLKKKHTIQKHTSHFSDIVYWCIYVPCTTYLNHPVYMSVEIN